MLTLDKLEKHNNTTGNSAVPDVGADLLEAEAAGYFAGMPADRVMAALELLRHREITPEQAAAYIGIKKEMIVALMRGLSIPFEM